MRLTAQILLVVICLAAILAGFLSKHPYDLQVRDAISAPPSKEFPLGTDSLGRDRLARLLEATRVSLFLAPAAAAVSTVLAGILGALAAYLGGIPERFFSGVTDAFLALPWLFVLLAVRALLPLNVSPFTSVGITFALLACLGWPAPGRVIRAGAKMALRSEYLIQARASGLSRFRIFRVHLLPNLRPILVAQFWIAVPAFILSEANLSLLGLGVAEPLPSWGSLLRELENFSMVGSSPVLLIPALLLVVTIGCFQALLNREGTV